ncbi:MAG: hypothetical protein AAFV95_00510 [Bacteroidota bacterium]
MVSRKESSPTKECKLCRVLRENTSLDNVLGVEATVHTPEQLQERESMKVKKILLYSIAIVFTLLVIGGIVGVRYFNNMWFKDRPDHLAFTSDFNPIAFEWTQSTYGDYIEKHDVIRIPVTIGNLPHQFYLQLDTGAPTTLLYETPLKSLLEMDDGLSIIEKYGENYLQELNLLMGGSKMELKTVKILPGYGSPIDRSDTTTQQKIGSIGADLLNKYITEINFKNQFLKFYAKREAWMNDKSNFQKFDFSGRRFMLPCTIEGKDHELFYDSGTSAFGLLTTRGRYRKYSKKETKEIVYDANRWGDALPIKHKATTTSMEMGGLEIPLRRVSYVDMYASTQGLIGPFTNIGGWLGNKPFLEYSLILDAPNEEFVILKK